MTITELLNKYNLKYEDLNVAEKETLENWLRAISNTELTVEAIKEYIEKMIDGVETELAEVDLPRNKDLFLKARLRNYLLLKSFLEGPEKARKALEKQLSSIKK